MALWRYGGITNRLFFPVKSKKNLRRGAEPPAPPMCVLTLEKSKSKDKRAQLSKSKSKNNQICNRDHNFNHSHLA